jgi:transposase-like protein
METNSRTDQRQQFWREHVANQASSGQSVRAYCRTHSLAEHSFYSWRRRLRKAEQPVRFAVVDTASVTQSAASIHIHLASGDRIEVRSGNDAATLGIVIGLLRQHQVPR